MCICDLDCWNIFLNSGFYKYLDNYENNESVLVAVYKKKENNKCGYDILYDCYKEYIHSSTYSNDALYELIDYNQTDVYIVCRFAIDTNNCKLIDNLYKCCGIDFHAAHIIINTGDGYNMVTPFMYIIQTCDRGIRLQNIPNEKMFLNILKYTSEPDFTKYLDNFDIDMNIGGNLLNTISAVHPTEYFYYFMDNFGVYMEDIHILYILLCLCCHPQWDTDDRIIKIMLGRNIDTELLNDIFYKKVLSGKNFYRFVNGSTLEILTNLGLRMDQEILFNFVKSRNVSAVDFLIKNGIQPNDESINYVFNLYDTPTILNIFIKYGVDLGCAKIEKKYGDFLEKINNCGIDSETIISYALNICVQEMGYNN